MGWVCAGGCNKKKEVIVKSFFRIPYGSKVNIKTSIEVFDDNFFLMDSDSVVFYNFY